MSQRAFTDRLVAAHEILDLLAIHERLRSRAVAQVLGLFTIDARVALLNLAAQELIERDERGEWRLTKRGRTLRSRRATAC